MVSDVSEPSDTTPESGCSATATTKNFDTFDIGRLAGLTASVSFVTTI